MSLECGVCHKKYTKSHTCLAGQCNLCLAYMRNLRLHRCPVTKIMNINVQNEIDNLQLIACEACDRKFSSSKRMRMWKSIQLCIDCYRVPQIQAEIGHTRRVLNHYYITRGFANCRMCNSPIIDTVSGRIIQAFEADHIQPKDKYISIGVMIRQGFPLRDIMEELAKCRLLCVRCHDIVTFAQQKTSILHIKHIDKLSSAVRNRIDVVVQDIESSLFDKVYS